MRRLVSFGSCLAAMVTGSVAAQAQTVEETLQFINEALQENDFKDHDGQPTVSRVRLMAGGKLVVEITKTKSGDRFTNVFEVLLRDLDVTRIKARGRSGHTSLSLGAKGPVTARLKCVMAAGTSHEWDLPSTNEIAVEFRQNPKLESELKSAFARLITMARRAAG